MYNVVTTLALSFLIGSSSFLQVTRTPTHTSLDELEFLAYQFWTVELAALERLGKIPYTFTYNGRIFVTTLVTSFLNRSF